MKYMTFTDSTNSNRNLTFAQLIQAPFTTGPLVVDFSQNQLILNGETLVLQPKVLELLIILCAANGNTLSKQELTEMLWPDTVVGPDSLANTMTRLRKILKDDAKNPVFIKTVQRKGYLWLPKVEPRKAKSKVVNHKYLLGVASIFTLAISLYFLVKPKTEKFPFPDLSIQKLQDGGFEIQVGIEGELTEEKKVAMLEELKRITGEENSDMKFTVDDFSFDCEMKEIDDNKKQHCEDKKAKQQ
jgi:DNA-binding winged helix-turn-helix (wHTH) protein